MLNPRLTFTTLFLAVFLVLALGVSPAASFSDPFTSWSLSLDNANKMTVPNYLNVNGIGYIENTPTGPGSFTFKEYAAFQATTNNFGEFILDYFEGYQLTGSLYGEGVVNSGQFAFEGGTLDLFVSSSRTYGTTADDFFGSQSGTKIASFDIVSGSGFTNPDTTPIGSVNTQFESTFLLPGYFFDPYGNDIALQSYPIEWLFALSNVTASYNVPLPGNLRFERFEQALFDSYGIVAEDDVPFSFYITNSGEFTIGVVPEPSTAFLLGTGLLSLGLIARRRR